MIETTAQSNSSTTRSRTKKSALAIEQIQPASSSPGQTKLGAITCLLSRDGGASLEDLVAATGWQPHTTRAALTNLRKKGHAVTKDKVDGVTRYTIKAAATEA